MSKSRIRLPEGMTVEEATDVLEACRAVDKPAVVSSGELETLQHQVTDAKAIFASALADETPQSVDALAGMDMAALVEPLVDGDVSLAQPETVDTLRQNPETLSGVGGSGDEGGASGGLDALSLDEQRELERMDRKRRAFEARDIERRVETLEREMCDLAGVDDVATVTSHLEEE